VILKPRVACGDRDIGQRSLLTWINRAEPRMAFGAPLSGGDRHEENQHQAGIPGYRDFRAWNSRLGGVVAKRQPFAVD
jgi:hypothetical protein